MKKAIRKTTPMMLVLGQDSMFILLTILPNVNNSITNPKHFEQKKQTKKRIPSKAHL